MSTLSRLLIETIIFTVTRLLGATTFYALVGHCEALESSTATNDEKRREAIAGLLEQGVTFGTNLCTLFISAALERIRSRG